MKQHAASPCKSHPLLSASNVSVHVCIHSFSFLPPLLLFQQSALYMRIDIDDLSLNPSFLFCLLCVFFSISFLLHPTPSSNPPFFHHAAVFLYVWVPSFSPLSVPRKNTVYSCPTLEAVMKL